MSFVRWVRTHLSPEQRSALTGGIRTDCVRSAACDLAYARYHREIWQLLRAESELLGMGGPVELISTLSARADGVKRAEDLLVCYAASRVAAVLSAEGESGRRPTRGAAGHVPEPDYNYGPRKRGLSQRAKDRLFWALLVVAGASVFTAFALIPSY